MSGGRGEGDSVSPEAAGREHRDYPTPGPSGGVSVPRPTSAEPERRVDKVKGVMRRTMPSHRQQPSLSAVFMVMESKGGAPGRKIDKGQGVLRRNMPSHCEQPGPSGQFMIQTTESAEHERRVDKERGVMRRSMPSDRELQRERIFHAIRGEASNRGLKGEQREGEMKAREGHNKNGVPEVAAPGSSSADLIRASQILLVSMGRKRQRRENPKIPVPEPDDDRREFGRHPNDLRAGSRKERRQEPLGKMTIGKGRPLKLRWDGNDAVSAGSPTPELESDSVPTSLGSTPVRVTQDHVVPPLPFADLNRLYLQKPLPPLSGRARCSREETLLSPPT